LVETLEGGLTALLSQEEKRKRVSRRSCRDRVIFSLTASQQELGSSTVWNLWVLTDLPASSPLTVQEWGLMGWLLDSWREEYLPC